MSSADNTDSKISTKLQLPLIGLEHFTSYKEKKRNTDIYKRDYIELFLLFPKSKDNVVLLVEIGP